jgi:hypothetical protein
MFRRGVAILEVGESVEIVMIELIDNRIDNFFQYFEVYPHSVPVEGGCPNRNLHFPVMPMGVFAVAGIISEMMGAGKVALNKYIEHSSLPSA